MVAPAVAELLAAAKEAIAECRWADAGEILEAVLAESESPEALDGLAEVSYHRGDYQAAIDLRERAYAAYRAAGDDRRAGRIAAYNLAFDHAAFHGNLAVANGWLERGRRLVEAAGDCPEQGWVELSLVLVTAERDAKQTHIDRALATARRFGDADLEFDALAHAGALMVEQGRIAEGMDLLDEAAAATRGGEVSSATTAGEIYCKMLLACEMALDVRRAQEWTSVANRLAHRSNVAWASAICRMHYGGLLTAAGRWPEAEVELEGSVQTYARSYPKLAAGAFVRLAALRLHQGRIDDAAALLAGHEQDDHAVGPLALLHLARAEPEMAATVIRRHLGKEPASVAHGPLLSLLVSAELSAGRPEQAEAVCARLEELAARVPVASLAGLARLSAGRVAGGRDEPKAVSHLEAALACFTEAGLTWHEARTRLELAALWRTHRAPEARSEASTALSSFERLGAARDADEAAALLRELGARGRTGPRRAGLLSRREQEVLELLGAGLSNAEIAERLFISRKTAAHHVSRVLTKLGLRNRAEAAAYSAGREPS